MATPLISDISDDHSEFEGVVKLELDEHDLPPPKYVYETEESSDQDPEDEDTAFEKLPPHKQRLYNKMVEFQTELHQQGVAGSLRCIIQGQQEQIHPLMPEHIAKKEMAIAVATATITKTEVLQTPKGPIKCITSILIKEEPSEIHVTKIIDAYKKETPTISEEAFIHTKRDPENVPESYPEYETNKSDYLPDDVPIKPEMDLDEAEDFVDNTIAIYNVENLDAGLSRICDGFLMAAQGYEDIRKELPNLDPMDLPKIFEQVPMPTLEKHTLPLQQLLTRSDEKEIVSKFVKQLVAEGFSLNTIKTEYGLLYNLIYEIVHGTK